MSLKHALRSGLGSSANFAKRVIGKNERLKNFAKGLIVEHVHLGNQAETDDYAKWVDHNYPDGVEMLRERDEAAKFAYRPLISVLIPTYNTNIDFLHDCIDSVRAQSYDNWQLCIVDDASTDSEVRGVIKEYAKQDKRISYLFREKNGHISRASNDAMGLAKGEFVALLDHDDVMWPNALYEVIKQLNRDKELDFLFSDEEKITKDRADHQDPFFKPDWNPEFMESINAITHLAVIRTTLMNKIGGFRVGFEGAQDWDLFLRIADTTKKIYHIPKVLYSWRISETSTAHLSDVKPYVREAQGKAIAESLVRRGYPDAKVVQGIILRDYWQVIHPVKGGPKVSIVIPTVNQFKVVRTCVNSIMAKTTYKNYEVIVVDTGSTDPKVRSWYKSIQKAHSNVHVYDWPEQPFSYSRTCNFGAGKATGEYLVMLNNDTEVVTANWLELLLGDAQRDGVGAVGCKLYYPDHVHIQHAGIGVGLGGWAANLLSPVHIKQRTPMQHLYGDTRHEVSAVTAACLMVKKSRFDEAHGFDEKLRITYNDVDLCLRLHEHGYRTLYNPMVELLHHESISVGRPEEKKVRDTKEFAAAKAMFKKRWRDVIENDPFLNPNIERTDALFSVKKY